MSDEQNAAAEAPKDGLAINVHDELTITERLGWKKISAGEKKSAVWGHGRDDVDRDTGRPTWKQLTFDGETDRYTETVTVKDTGEVILKKDERLSEHQGRGSARTSSAVSEEPGKRDNLDTSGKK